MCVYICVCMCWNPVNMQGCGRDGGFVTMKLRLDHHLPRRPCTFLHEMGGFTHEWSLQLLPFDEGIYLMCKSFAKGQYLRWLQLSRLVFACRKVSSIFAVATKLWSYISSPKVKFKSIGDDDTNLFICSFVASYFHIVVVNTAFSDWVYICEVDVPAKFWSCIAYVIKEADCSCGTQSLFFDLLPRSHLRHSDRPNFNLVRKY